MLDCAISWWVWLPYPYGFVSMHGFVLSCPVPLVKVWHRSNSSCQTRFDYNLTR